MRTGDFRGAGPFAHEWILEPGRQRATDNRPKVRKMEHADAPDMVAFVEVDTPGAWVRAEEAVEVRP